MTLPSDAWFPVHEQSRWTGANTREAIALAVYASMLAGRLPESIERDDDYEALCDAQPSLEEYADEAVAAADALIVALNNTPPRV